MDSRVAIGKNILVNMATNRVAIFNKIQLVIDRAIESVKQAFGLPRLW